MKYWKRTMAISVCFVIIIILNSSKPKEAFAGRFVVDTLAAGLIVPWDIAFLPDSSILFTERTGKVRLMKKGKLETRPLLAIPDVEVAGKMGLLALCLHPSFNTNKTVYLAYNYRVDKITFLRIARYTYTNDSLVNQYVLIEKIPAAYNHTGCRLKFGPDKKLYITTGDADIPRLSQDLKVLNGKILRLNDDGSIPADNPFLGNDTARHEIWTYGHRNSQGIAFQPLTGFLYDSEHGPTGGDEINTITKGNNYGWPMMHHRDNKDGFMAPILEFTPSIGPAEAIFYSGKAFPAMKGNLLVSCMRGEAILNISFTDKKISSYNFLLSRTFGRIRAIAEGPDGYIYFSTSQIDPPEKNIKPGETDFDMILRIRPAGEATSNISTTYAIPEEKMQLALNNGHPGTSKRTTTELYAQLCAGCHGTGLEGVDKVSGLIGKELVYGNSVSQVKRSITAGIISKGMPAWEGVLNDKETADLVNFIIAKRKSAALK